MIGRRVFFAALFGAPALVVGKPDSVAERIREEMPAVLASAVSRAHERQFADAWEQPIREYVRFRRAVTLDQVFEIVLRLEPDRIRQADRNRVAACLRAAGWKRARCSAGRSYIYCPFTQAAREEAGL